MKKILVINFFPAFFPPTSGGELRYFNMYKHLSAYYDITLLSPTYNDHKMEVVTFSESFREYRIPKEDIHNEIYWKLEQEDICSEVSALACAISSEYPNLYHDKYLELYKDSDIIIHESPYMLRYDLFFGFDDKPRIYNSYNCETSLVSQMWKGKNAEKYIKIIHELENEIVNKSDLVFATCDEDVRNFISLFNPDKSKIKLAPNGINPEDYVMRDNSNQTIENNVLFIGSGHPPNVEAVEFIINNIADKCKNINFKIAGSCCKNIKSNNKLNVELLGFVNQEEKEKLFRTSKCAINPMFSGSGTNLKTLEFFSSGIPLVSTEVGVRGLGVNADEHYVNATESEFAEKINEVVNNIESVNSIVLNGRNHINGFFSWKKISEDAFNEIESVCNKEHIPTFIVLCDYSISNPNSGGEIRSNQLYRNISYRYKIIFICLNDNKQLSLSLITPRFLEISIPKTAEHLKEQRKINERFWVSSVDIISSYMCVKNKFLVSIVNEVITFADGLILSQPYMSNLVNDKLKIPIIYESQNNELHLKENLLKSHPDYKFLLDRTKKTQERAISISKIIITCSKEEMYADLNKPVFIIENGVEIPLKNNLLDLNHLKQQFNDHTIAIFIGSGHIPNVEAANFIIETLANEMPHVYFMIVGSVCGAYENQSIPDNVLLMGLVSSKSKEILMQLVDVAINPMISGSGSNLKLADYFSANIPTVTTKLGARGYDIVNEEHTIICDLSDFSKAIKDLSNNSELSEKIKMRAFRYVFEKLDWRSLAHKYVDVLDKHILNRKLKKVLVVTYRINEPEKGGAEVYLKNVLQNINSNKVGYIDIAALNIGNLYNYKHFSTSFDYDSNVYQSSYFDKQVYKFNVDHLPSDKIDFNCRELYKLYVSESRKISLEFLDDFTFPILMGGWYYPQKGENGICVWSSPNALIFTGGSNSIKISGSSPFKQKIIIKQSEDYYNEFNVDGSFSVSTKLNKLFPIVEIITSTYATPDDVRELGILVKEIILTSEAGNVDIQLDNDYKTYMSKQNISKYVDSLISNAKQRNDEINNLFRETRGPISKELELWLNLNISRYDIVIVHNVPFATTLIASDIAIKNDIPLIALPHFHFEDEFYHWKDYYELFNKAKSVVIAPEISKSLFYEKITQDNLSIIPGGGINPSEYLNIDLSKFECIYNNELPFVLVLGRKSSAKNYSYVIDAVDKINKDNKQVNLVMIGADEDGIDVTSKDVLYFGKQPREVVLAALSKCIAVVNMSESESFGIVILEAWAVKKPVIVNENCYAFIELVEHGINGLISDKNNLAPNIMQLLENPCDCERMGENGFAKAQNKYSWSKISESFELLFK